MAEPIEGKSYLCKKTIVMRVWDGGKYRKGKKAYQEGKTYKSEFEGCVTDDSGNINHEWNDDPLDIYPGYTFSDVFEEVKENE